MACAIFFPSQIVNDMFVLMHIYSSLMNFATTFSISIPRHGWKLGSNWNDKYYKLSKLAHEAGDFLNLASKHIFAVTGSIVTFLQSCRVTRFILSSKLHSALNGLHENTASLSNNNIAPWKSVRLYNVLLFRRPRAFKSTTTRRVGASHCGLKL